MSAFCFCVRRVAVLFAMHLLALGVFACQANAHPVSDFNIRVVHFEQRADGMVAYFRLSFPLLVANASGPAGAAQGATAAAPYTYDRLESGRVFHYLDSAAVQRDVAGLGRTIAEGHRVAIGGHRIDPRVLSVRIHPKGFVPPFTTLEQARAAVQGQVFPTHAPETEAKFVLVDAALAYPLRDQAAQFQFSSRLAADIAGAPVTENLLLLHRDAGVTTYATAGLLETPVTINASLAAAVKEFLGAGISHILRGWDHLLFVICLVIGDLKLKSIALRITGFSIGHSISLVAGFYGWIPGGTWFQPWIEVAIALSLLCAAAMILTRDRFRQWTVPLTTAVGLVHGIGFAFGLREMLADSSVHVLPSLLFFNLGVEAGQLIIAAAAWWLLYAIRSIGSALYTRIRTTIAMASAGVSLFWLMQRLALAMGVD